MGVFITVFIIIGSSTQVGPVMLNTVLPAVVLTLINQLTNYFHWPDMFETVVANTSSVLMTLAAVFISYFQSLPSSPTIRWYTHSQPFPLPLPPPVVCFCILRTMGLL